MPGKDASTKEIQFAMENLLSPENLMEPDSVAVLQSYLNKYVAGWDKLEPYGVFGHQTARMVQQYRNERRFWGGHETIKIDPKETAKHYEKSKNKKITKTVGEGDDNKIMQTIGE